MRDQLLAVLIYQHDRLIDSRLALSDTSQSPVARRGHLPAAYSLAILTLILSRAIPAHPVRSALSNAYTCTYAYTQSRGSFYRLVPRLAIYGGHLVVGYAHLGCHYSSFLTRYFRTGIYCGWGWRPFWSTKKDVRLLRWPWPR